MKFDIISDIHAYTNNRKNPRFILNAIKMRKNSDSEGLLIAGDTEAPDIIEMLKDEYRSVIFCNGNHDWYDYDITDVQNDYPKFLNRDGTNWIQDEREDSTVIITWNGWYAPGDSFIIHNEKYLSDEIADFHPEYGIKNSDLFAIKDISMRDIGIVQDWLDIYGENPRIKEIVIMTHVPPVFKSYRDNMKGSISSSIFFNERLLEILMVNHEASKKIKKWVSGHDHVMRKGDYFEFDGLEIEFWSNPLGYVSMDYEFQNLALSKEKLFQIDI